MLNELPLITAHAGCMNTAMNSLQTCHTAIAASCCGINMDYKDCREAFLAYARLRCLPVLVYTIDDPAEMERFIRSGVHSITTNDVQALRSLKRGR